jgi:hypothetical protein
MPDDVNWLQDFLTQKAPRSEAFQIRQPLEADEAHWFRRGVEVELFKFFDCGPDCPRFRKWKESGPDEFRAAAGESPGIRHLFSLWKPVNLNREYIPHMAAVARLVVECHYDQARSSFSRYRKFTRDLLWKRKGQSYESDAEFYDLSGNIWLQVEAKQSQNEVLSIIKAIESTTKLVGDQVPKELEYVLDLKPRYLWLVAPGMVDPSRYVYEVEVEGLSAILSGLERIPPPR